ncbi:Holliday junction branch migration protein RuvA [Patescibacteria group bacterium]|nr:Holliday junction branch migration protein RuvA [Patescibacteria group bacterium]
MIASLTGKVEYLERPYIVVNVNGIGYEVLASESVFTNLSIDQKIHIFTYTYVRDDALELFGFSERADLKLFESLISVSGVGPKTAVSIFSIGTGAQITEAIARADLQFFTKVPRLGKKNAQKIIIELKNKIGSKEELDLTEEDKKSHSEVEGALRGFGFSAKESREATDSIKDHTGSAEEKIKLALKFLGK